MAFDCKESLESHIKIIHPKLWNDYLEKNIDDDDLDRVPEEFQGEKFIHWTMMKKQVKTRHDCQWTGCNLSFVSKELLERHIKIIHLKLWSEYHNQNYLEKKIEQDDDEHPLDFQIESIQTLTEEQF